MSSHSGRQTLISDSPVLPLSNPPCSTTSYDPQKMGEICQNRCKKRRDVLVLIQDKSYRHTTTINTLPDNGLLDIFDFYRISHYQDRMAPFRPVWDWHRLAHVSRRWRQIVFASPRRLDLQILCTHRTPVREVLGYWPVFPIVIDDTLHNNLTPHDEDNIIAALEHSDRVRSVQLRATGSQLGKVATAMQDSFPMLTHLRLSSKDENIPVFDEGFLGGPAPCLQEIDLDGIPLPSLPTHVSSATCLVSLRLRNIPETGLISPEAMITCLASLAQLRDLQIEFRSPTPRRPRLAVLQTLPRAVLSTLTSFTFRGVCEYLEDLVARIVAPRLDSINIRFFNQLVDFQFSQLLEFIKHSKDSEHARFRQAEVTFGNHWVSFSLRHENHSHRRPITISVSCDGIEWQVSHIAHVANQFSAMLSDVAHLAITQVERKFQQEGMDDTGWLQLLRPFTAVRMLRVSREFTGHVALALEDVTWDTVAEVLPALDLLCLVGQPVPSSSIKKFVAIRRDSGRPVTIVNDPWHFYRRPHLSK